MPRQSPKRMDITKLNTAAGFIGLILAAALAADNWFDNSEKKVVELSHKMDLLLLQLTALERSVETDSAEHVRRTTINIWVEQIRRTTQFSDFPPLPAR